MTETLFDPQNPVFHAYMIAAALMVLKLMGQGWMTVWRMMRIRSGFASPEDLRPTLLNPVPAPDQLEINDYVDRSRRMHRNDLENIPGFLAAGLIFAATNPPYGLAVALYGAFVLARLAHTLAYALAANHETRATFYTIGSLSVIAMALYTLWSALF